VPAEDAASAFASWSRVDGVIAMAGTAAIVPWIIALLVIFIAHQYLF
jgi:hypothetical protein